MSDSSSPSLQRVVVISGAGVSAESGLKTFRGNDGLWEGQRVEEVATPSAWENDPGRVLRFYNERRKQVRHASPNAAHLALAELEQGYEVDIVTQNVDDLHERAGSSRVLHLHGEIMLARSTLDQGCLIPLGNRDIELGETCPRGGQLRPHIVWFGEEVPALAAAAEIVAAADILLCIGTSLQVYPAATLVFLAPEEARRIVIDPIIPQAVLRTVFECLARPAGEGVPLIVEELLRQSADR